MDRETNPDENPRDHEYPLEPNVIIVEGPADISSDSSDEDERQRPVSQTTGNQGESTTQLVPSRESASLPSADASASNPSEPGPSGQAVQPLVPPRSVDNSSDDDTSSGSESAYAWRENGPPLRRLQHYLQWPFSRGRHAYGFRDNPYFLLEPYLNGVVVESRLRFRVTWSSDNHFARRSVDDLRNLWRYGNRRYGHSSIPPSGSSSLPEVRDSNLEDISDEEINFDRHASSLQSSNAEEISHSEGHTDLLQVSSSVTTQQTDVSNIEGDTDVEMEEAGTRTSFSSLEETPATHVDMEVQTEALETASHSSREASSQTTDRSFVVHRVNLDVPTEGVGIATSFSSFEGGDVPASRGNVQTTDVTSSYISPAVSQTETIREFFASLEDIDTLIDVSTEISTSATSLVSVGETGIDRNVPASNMDVETETDVAAESTASDSSPVATGWIEPERDVLVSHENIDVQTDEVGAAMSVASLDVLSQTDTIKDFLDQHMDIDTNTVDAEVGITPSVTSFATASDTGIEGDVHAYFVNMDVQTEDLERTSSSSLATTHGTGVDGEDHESVVSMDIQTENVEVTPSMLSIAALHGTETYNGTPRSIDSIRTPTEQLELASVSSFTGTNRGRVEVESDVYGSVVNMGIQTENVDATSLYSLAVFHETPSSTISIGVQTEEQEFTSVSSFPTTYQTGPDEELHVSVVNVDVQTDDIEVRTSITSIVTNESEISVNISVSFIDISGRLDGSGVAQLPEVDSDGLDRPPHSLQPVVTILAGPSVLSSESSDDEREMTPASQLRVIDTTQSVSQQQGDGHIQVPDVEMETVADSEGGGLNIEPGVFLVDSSNLPGPSQAPAQMDLLQPAPPMEGSRAEDNRTPPQPDQQVPTHSHAPRFRSFQRYRLFEGENPYYRRLLPTLFDRDGMAPEARRRQFWFAHQVFGLVPRSRGPGPFNVSLYSTGDAGQFEVSEEILHHDEIEDSPVQTPRFSGELHSDETGSVPSISTPDAVAYTHAVLPLDVGAAQVAPFEVGIAVDEPLAVGVALNEPLEHGGVLDEPLEVGVALDEPLEVGEALDQPLEVGVALDEPLELEGVLDEPLDVGVTPNEPLEHEGALDKPLEVVVALDVPLEVGGVLDESLEVGVTLDKPMKFGGDLYEPLEGDVALNEHLRVGVALNELSELGGDLDEPLEVVVAIDEPMEVGGTLDEPMEVGVAVDKILKLGGALDEPLEGGVALNERLGPGAALDEPLKVGVALGELLEHGGASDEPLQVVVALDEPMEVGGALDEPLEGCVALDEHLEADAAVDESLEVGVAVETPTTTDVNENLPASVQTTTTTAAPSGSGGYIASYYLDPPGAEPSTQEQRTQELGAGTKILYGQEVLVSAPASSDSESEDDDVRR